MNVPLSKPILIPLYCQAKLGWGRRRDSGNAPVIPKLAGERSPSKRLSQAEDENGSVETNGLRHQTRTHTIAIPAEHFTNDDEVAIKPGTPRTGEVFALDIL